MWYQAGDIIRVRVHGVIFHEGIITEHGRVISNSRRRGGVFEESLRVFSGGKKIQNLGALAGFDPQVAVNRARSQIGQPYDLVAYNCQHFVRWCYGLKPKSHQKRVAFGAAALLGVLWFI